MGRKASLRCKDTTLLSVVNELKSDLICEIKYKLPPNQTEPRTLIILRLASDFFIHIFEGAKNGPHQVLDDADPPGYKSLPSKTFSTSALSLGHHSNVVNLTNIKRSKKKLYEAI